VTRFRHQRRTWAEHICEEAKHGLLRSDELIDLAASRLTSTAEPLVFDAMNPKQKALWARRVLRVVWILTDTACNIASNRFALRHAAFGAGEDVVAFLDERVALKTFLKRDRVLQRFAVGKLRVSPAAGRRVFGGVPDHELHAVSLDAGNDRPVGERARLPAAIGINRRVVGFDDLLVVAKLMYDAHSDIDGHEVDPVALAIALMKDHPEW
jgi:hypothetical protein